MVHVFKLRWEKSVFFAEKNFRCAMNFDHKWAFKLANLASIFKVLSVLNANLQRKRSDIFPKLTKLMPSKEKIDCWTNTVSKNNYSFFDF